MKLNVAFSIESEDFIFEFLESFKRTKRHALREIMVIVPSNIIEKKTLVMFLHQNGGNFAPYQMWVEQKLS